MMDKFVWLFGMFLALVFVGCYTMPQFTYTHAPIYQGQSKVIEVFVDKQFSDDDKVSISNALNDWNYALNGYERFQIVLLDFDMVVSDIRRAERGVLILRIDSRSRFIPKSDVDGTVVDAFTDKIGGHLIYVVRDRISGQTVLENVLRHEIGHTLRTRHIMDSKSLMNPVLSPVYSRCIDYATMKSVAKEQGLNISHLRYCRYW